MIELLGFELLAFDFHLTSHSSVCFICVYLPPLGSMNLCTVDNLLKVLRRFMAGQEVYVIGDFNFSNYKANNTIPLSTYKQPLQNFLYFLEDYHLKQLVRESTHIAHNILDLVITSKPQNVTSVDIIHPLTNTCDHNMIEIKLNINTSMKNNGTPKLNYYAANYTHINQYLSSINWDTVFVENENINQMYNKFLDVVHTSIKLFVPKSKNPRKPYLPKEIKKLLNKKRKLYKKSKTDSTFKPAYKAHEKLYKTAIKNYKHSCEEKVLSSNSKKVLYNHIKNKLHSRHFIPPLHQSQNQICLDSESKANLLNNTFAKVFLNENSTKPPPTPITTHQYIPYNNVSPISPREVFNTILKMKKSVSQTPDGIPSYYIYRTASQLSKPLSILFNYSISTGQVPEIWKKALVTPIYKK